MKTKVITYSVLVLSLVSLCTDVASEMLYPVMPVYLKSIGFSIVLIGFLEGCAEAIAALTKGYFGHLSDQAGKRVPFVRIGYMFSALSKPMMGLFVFPWWIFAARTIDRLGKGVRTGARDALLSDESTSENKAKVFGFHRALDTLGATIGPVFALAFLYVYPGQYQWLFFIAFVPGLISILLTFLLKEKKSNREPKAKTYSFFQFFRYWKDSPSSYKSLVAGLVVFAFFNSSDVFLLLMIKEKGFSDIQVIQMYIFYNLCFALLSYPFGHLADKVGLRYTFIVGLILFTVVYGGMAYNTSLIGFYLLFFVYAVFASCTEGVSKAWISNIADKKDTATALGLYGTLNSITAIAASTFAGFIWTSYTPETTFMISALGVTGIVFYFLLKRSALSQ